MSRTLRPIVVSGLLLALGASPGCSDSGTAETPQIEGKTPADFRESAEKALSRPLGEPPAKGAPNSKKAANR